MYIRPQPLSKAPLSLSAPPSSALAHSLLSSVLYAICLLADAAIAALLFSVPTLITMQHSLHLNDRVAFSTASDHDRRASPSSSSCASWAAATSTTCSSSVDNSMHSGSAATQGPGSYFRHLLSEEAGAEAAGSYVQELLQLQLLPPAASTEVSFLSSPDVYDTYASSRCSVGDFDSPSAFSVEGFLTSGGAAPESPEQKGPHTLEFVSPPALASVSPPAQSSCFQELSRKNRRVPDAAASSTLLPEVQSSPVDGSLRYAKVSDALYGKANSFNGEEEEPHTVSQTVASSFKKARLQASEQCSSGAGSDSSQFMSKGVQSSARSKEKLGERINALQQLVSPFGKTDTASVLSEAIGYIKFLQDQVQVLSSPYMKPTSTFTHKDMGEESASDLRSRGLCLVPVSCTLNVANNNNFNIGADYWASTPSVGGSTPSTRFSASS